MPHPPQAELHRACPVGRMVANEAAVKLIEEQGHMTDQTPPTINDLCDLTESVVSIPAKVPRKAKATVVREGT